MWKRMVVLCIALFCTFSAAYAFYNNYLTANTLSTRSGGNVTGRVHKAPAGISGSHIGLQKGDKILTGVSNPAHASENNQ